MKPGSDAMKDVLTHRKRSKYEGESLIEMLREKHTMDPHPKLGVRYDQVYDLLITLDYV